MDWIYVFLIRFVDVVLDMCVFVGFLVLVFWCEKYVVCFVWFVV